MSKYYYEGFEETPPMVSTNRLRWQKLKEKGLLWTLKTLCQFPFHLVLGIDFSEDKTDG